MEGLKVTFGEALGEALRARAMELPQSAEPDRAFVEGLTPEKMVRLNKQHPNLHKRVPALRSVPPFGQPEPPLAPSAPVSSSPPPTEVVPVPKAAKKRTAYPPETKRKVLELVAGGMPQVEAARKHGVKNAALVSQWVARDREQAKHAAKTARRAEPTLRSRPEPPPAPARSFAVVADELAAAVNRVEALKAEMRRLLE